MNLVRTFLLILAATIATPAAAQDDWDLGRDPGRRLTVAAVNFDSFGVAVRCVDDVMSVVVSGLPVERRARIIRHRIGDQPEMTGSWVSAGDGSAAFSIWPAATAAYLSRGGRWVLEVPDGEKIRRISADLPASPSAIGEVFAACGRTLTPTSLVDEPSQEEFGILRWVRMPDVSVPSRGGIEAESGSRAEEAAMAALSCTVTARGALRACRVESEFPEGSGFGRAAVIRAHREGRVGPEDPDSTVSMEGQRVCWVIRFNMEREIPLPTVPSDIPSQPEPGRRPLAWGH